MTEPPTSPGPPLPPPPPRQAPGFGPRHPIRGCGPALLILLGLVLLLPGACVIAYVKDHPGQLLAQGSDVLWTFLMISAGGVVLIVVAIRQLRS